MRICCEDKIEIVLFLQGLELHTSKHKLSQILVLFGAVLVARLMVTVLEGLKGILIDNVYCSANSMTELCWIQSVKCWGQYVLNCVDESRLILQVSLWNDIPGTEIPADLLSRGVSGYKLVNLKLWLKGPIFLE